MAQLIPEAQAGKLDAEFLNPPLTARPEVIWYWRHELHTKEGITADLEAMNRVGIGGVLIGFIGGHDEPKGDVTILSPKWREMFRHAVVEASRLGMRVNIWNSPGWSSSGGPWIPPELAMQKLTWSETRLNGPGKLPAPLPRPHASKLGNTWSVTKEKPALWNDYYRDIAVLAFPTPAAEKWDGTPPVVACDDPKFDATKTRDGDPATFSSLANPVPGQTNWIRFDFGKPFPARSLAVSFREWDGSAKVVEVEQSDDGGTWRAVRRCAVRGSQGLPVNATLDAAPARHWRLGFVSDAKGPAKMDLAEIALLSGVRIEDWTGKAMFDKFGLHKPPLTATPATADAAIPRDRILDLTDRLRPDGTLDWEAPAGDWTVVRYGRTLTLALNGPATPPGTGLECDKLNAAALDHHWNSYLAPLFADEDFNRGVACVHIDSYEKHAQNWSPRLPEEFRKRRGYDIIRFLPAMTGRVIDSVETTERFLWDLRQTICDTMADAYFGRMAELCHKQGKLFSVEPYHQVQFDNVTVGGRGDLIVTEFWNGGWPGPYWFKLGASPAHIYGKRVVGAEAFTAGSKDGGDWSTDPWALKALGDSAYCSGVNHFIFHVSTQQPWTNAYPGLTSGPWGQHIERGNTWFDLSGGWLRYLARCQHMLQQGQFVGDVLYSVGENTPNESHDGGKGLPPGYDYDTISPEAILTRLTVKEGRLVLPDGVSYTVLVLPEGDDFMTAAMARKLRDLVKAGGTILGPRPRRSPSLRDQPAEDETVRAVAAELWGDMNGKARTENRVGAGRVFCGKPLAEVLRAIGVRPDFAYTAQGLSLKSIHRRTREAEFYFVSDATWPIRAATAPAVSLEARFRVAGCVPELWDAVTGEIRPLPDYREENGETVVPLRFEPRQSWFVVFREKAAAVAERAAGKNFPATTNLCEIVGPWEVRFDPKWGGPAAPVTFTNLQDWSKHADPGIRYYSGTAAYRTTFQTARDAKDRLFLNLGTLKNVASVRLNGQELGVVWCAPWRVEITQAMRPGTNDLEITVANLWPNRLIGDEQLQDDCAWTMTGFGTAQLKAWPDWLLGKQPRTSGRLTFASWKHWNKDAPLFNSGLLGPVTIQAMRNGKRP
jgi:hypothetical protein